MPIRRNARPRPAIVEARIEEPVLVVEDMHSVSALLTEMLERRWGCEVHVANSLAEARSLLAERHNYLAAVCDLALPDAPRGEIVELMLGAGVPVIGITAAFGEEMRTSILARGVVDYVLKDSVDAYGYVCNLVGRLAHNRSLSVLALEGSPAVGQQLQDTLGRYKLKVLRATSAEEALEQLKTRRDIRVLLVDHDNPSVNALALTAEARRLHGKEQLAIIGMSGRDSPMVSASFLKNGGNDYIRKPFHFEELVCRVHLHVEMLELLDTNVRAATRDFLTGLYNRRHFFVHGQQRLAEGQRCSVLLIDVDHFKQFNDRHGHEAGDQVLRTLGEQFLRAFQNHLPARIGGEEFAVLMFGEPYAAVERRAEALRRTIAQTPLNLGGEEVTVTISVGLAPVPGRDLDGALCEADARLYLAKNRGRNRTVSTRELPEAGCQAAAETAPQ